jgi:hypothetical protein
MSRRDSSGSSRVLGGSGQAAGIARTLDTNANRRRSDAAIRTMPPPAETIAADEPWRFVR